MLNSLWWCFAKWDLFLAPLIALKNDFCFTAGPLNCTLALCHLKANSVVRLGIYIFGEPMVNSKWCWISVYRVLCCAYACGKFMKISLTLCLHSLSFLLWIVKKCIVHETITHTHTPNWNEQKMCDAEVCAKDLWYNKEKRKSDREKQAEPSK